MAVQTITYGDKSYLNENADIPATNKVQDTDMNEIKSVVNNNATELLTFQEKIGKVLWEGSFSTGTLTVPNLNQYTMIIIQTGNLLMFGNQNYGGSPFRVYQSATINSYGYRFTYDENSNTLTTDTNNPGASDGASQLTISKIIGVF